MSHDDESRAFSAGYEGEAGRMSARTYEALDPAELHAWLIPYLPAAPAAVLDVGSGSGRDAAWLALEGYEVVAVEPSPTMREEAESRHGAGAGDRIRWIDDALPGLERTLRLGASFDLILLSAVWMHVAPGGRAAVHFASLRDF